MKLKTVIHLSVLFIIAKSGYGNPTGGFVASGEAQITQPSSGAVQVNQNSNKAIINWQSFNIQNGETTRFAQPSAHSIVLNRVNPFNGNSSIFGNLVANGQVWLINPAGIVFGSMARVDVGGLLATTSNIRDEDFLSRKYKFFSEPGFASGSVINEGHIQIQTGGLVGLIGNTVSNRGVILAKMGTVVLAGAQAYTIDFDGDQLINFVVQKGASGAVSNSGTIDVSSQGLVIEQKTARTLVMNSINLEGIEQATQIVVRDSVIVLLAGDGTVDLSGKMLADAAGSIHIQANSINANNASLSIQGGVSGGKITLSADGTVHLVDTQLNTNGIDTGGTIHVLGKTITIENSSFQANGNLGGGEILIGGNAHGVGAENNAYTTFVNTNTSLTANALINGNGGKVVLWSDNGTGFYGTIEAKGGAEGGNGGWVETSGKSYLEAFGTVNASAINGLAGEWLIDPANISIQNAASTNGSFDGLSPNACNVTGDNAIVNVNTINASLNGGTNVTILATAAGTQNGDITLESVDSNGLAISKTAGGAATLTLTAGNTGKITINNTISSSSGTLGIVLNGAKTILINSSITTLGGTFTSTSTEATRVSAPINTGAGTATFNVNTGGIGVNNFTISRGGSITTTNTTANAVTINLNTDSGGNGGAVLGGNITTGSGGRITINTYAGYNSIVGSISESENIVILNGQPAFSFTEFHGGLQALAAMLAGECSINAQCAEYRTIHLTANLYAPNLLVQQAPLKTLEARADNYMIELLEAADHAKKVAQNQFSELSTKTNFGVINSLFANEHQVLATAGLHETLLNPQAPMLVKIPFNFDR